MSSRTRLAVIAAALLASCSGAQPGDASDASVAALDVGRQDASTLPPDAATPDDDAAVAESDASQAGRDAAASGDASSVPDAAAEANDASSSGDAAGLPGVDASQAGRDAGSPGVDASEAGRDASSPGVDASQAGRDAASAGRDAAPTPLDASCTGANSFAATATSWTLPSTYPAYPLIANSSCTGTTQEPLYTVMDMDGDGKLDLVVTFECAHSGTTVGTTHWNVFLNTGTGFATTPITWALPSAYPAYPLIANSSCAGTTQEPFYTVMDMSGDGRPDLVVTFECNHTGTTVGVTHWNVFQNTGAGFATTATSWALPSTYPAYPLIANSSCTGTTQEPFYTVMDMNGDWKPDLVVTFECNHTGTTVGVTHWNVFQNTGTGFATTATSWGLPSTYPAYPLIANSSCPGTTQEPYYTVMDVNGDWKPDLVVTFECNHTGTTVGVTHWNVFQNTGTGFATTATSWALPSTYPGYPLIANSSCTGTTQEPFYTVMDLDGDGRPDLVVTFECNHTGTTVGVTHWNVFLGRCF